MGVGKDFCVVGSNYLIDRFVHRSQEILSEAEWSKLPDIQRKAVEDAALNIGLTIEQLKERLQEFAESKQETQAVSLSYLSIEQIDSGAENAVSALTRLPNPIQIEMLLLKHLKMTS